jgi:hypothetical protein
MHNLDHQKQLRIRAIANSGVTPGRRRPQEDWSTEIPRMLSQDQRRRPRSLRACHPCRPAHAKEGEEGEMRAVVEAILPSPSSTAIDTKPIFWHEPSGETRTSIESGSRSRGRQRCKRRREFYVVSKGCTAAADQV